MLTRKPRYNKMFRLPFTIPNLRPKELAEAEIRYKEYDKEYDKKYKPRKKMLRRRRDALWPNERFLMYNSDEVVGSEKYIMNEILPKLGYTDLKWTREYNDKFFCDIIGVDSEDRVCCFDVKLSSRMSMKMKKFELIKALRVRYFVVHLYPDHSFYYMVEMIVNGRRSSSAYTPYMEFLKTKPLI